MSARGLSRPAEILLVEDCAADVEVIKQAFGQVEIRNRVSVVIDGDEALAFLRRQGRFEGAPRPDLIFLDLKLPKVDGWQVLEMIKADPGLTPIPVVILAASKSPEDVRRGLRLQASCFVRKPSDVGEFMSAVRTSLEFWLSVVELPGQCVSSPTREDRYGA